MKRPIAILLTKFSDTNAEPLTREDYEEIFTASGDGKWNMVQYFRDMSHGSVDIGASEVFGWFTIDTTTTDYGKQTNSVRRPKLIADARAKATEAGVDLSRFFSLVVCLNTQSDLFGGGDGAVAGHDGSDNYISGLAPSLLGQEMGHIFGLNHSRREGSVADYQDPYDIMSTAGVFQPGVMAPNPVHNERDPRGDPVRPIGPGLNAANMDSRLWLDETRVTHAGGSVTLRPLHRPDLPGLLAAKFGDYYVEFRMDEGWDAGFAAPCVLVHTLVDNISYACPDQNGRLAWGVGSTLATPPELSVLGSGFVIAVTAIDPVARSATLTLAASEPRIPRPVDPWGPFRTPWIAWLERALQGGSRPDDVAGPGRAILQQLEMMQGVGTAMSPELRQAVRREALENIAALASAELERMRIPGGVAPPELAARIEDGSPG
ncbi:MAG: hypothetical protein U1E59_08320 [Amaricoccus sp.]